MYIFWIHLNIQYLENHGGAHVYTCLHVHVNIYKYTYICVYIHKCINVLIDYQHIHMYHTLKPGWGPSWSSLRATIRWLHFASTGSYLHESFHMYQWVMSHMWMSEWVMSRMWMSHDSYENESCLICEWVMSQMWMREWVMSRMCMSGYVMSLRQYWLIPARVTSHVSIIYRALSISRSEYRVFVIQYTHTHTHTQARRNTGTHAYTYPYLRCLALQHIQLDFDRIWQNTGRFLLDYRARLIEYCVFVINHAHTCAHTH